jgi:MFS family permease
MADFAIQGRPLAPPLYGVMTLSPGAMQGLVTVTLGYVLAHRGFTAAEIGVLIGLFLLPAAMRFVTGPLLDLVLGPRAWALLSILASSICALILAVTPLTRTAMPLLAADVFALGVVGNVLYTALGAALAVTTPNRQRGAVAAWMSSGFIGGIGLGGGLGLWLATHAGGLGNAALTLAALTLLCATPLVRLRVPPVAGRAQFRAHMAGVWAAAADLARTRAGVLAAIVVTLPVGLGAAANLLPAVADDWRASADLVAAVTGVFGGLIAAPGAILGGYLSDRFPRRAFFLAAALAYGAAEAAMAFAPHTPLAFAIFVPLGAFLLGAPTAACNTVMFERLGAEGAATVVAILGSLANLPVSVMTAFVGYVETAHGATAMLAAEAGVGVVAAVAYVLLAWLWRPSPTLAHV